MEPHLDHPITIAIQQFHSGQYETAEALCLEILSQDPEDPEALHLFGQLLARSGLAQTGLEMIQRAITNRPDQSHYRLTLAELQRQFEDPQALGSARQVILEDPGNGNGYLIMARILADQKHWLACYAQADFAEKILADPEDQAEAQALQVLAQNHLDHSLPQEIKTQCLNQAQQYLEQGQEAQQLAQPQQAFDLYTRALEIQPDLAEAENALGNLLGSWGYPKRAIRHHQRAIYLCPDQISYRLNLGMDYQRLGELRAAESCYEHALAVDPAAGDAISALAGIRDAMGDKSKALELLTPFIQPTCLSPELSITYANLASTEEEIQTAATLINACLRDTDLTGYDRKRLLFALGSLQDRLGQFDQAFCSYQQANSLYSGGPGGQIFDPDQHIQWIKQIKTIFSSDRMGILARSDQISELPVFIVGMPRSGTSLVEQILSCHPQVYGAGEREDIRRIAEGLRLDLSSLPYPEYVPQLTQADLKPYANSYVNALQALDPSAKRVTDKMPTNFLYLGLIGLLWPQARVIHCVRNPLDTCLSCYFHDFVGHPYSYDLTHLGIYYGEYHALMQHWQTVLDLALLNVQYENLVQYTEETCRQILEFCGLNWDPRCLTYYRSSRFTRTASSKQVKQPIYTSSIKRYKQYKHYLAPLIEILSDSLNF